MLATKCALHAGQDNRQMIALLCTSFGLRPKIPNLTTPLGACFYAKQIEIMTFGQNSHNSIIDVSIICSNIYFFNTLPIHVWHHTRARAWAHSQFAFACPDDKARSNYPLCHDIIYGTLFVEDTLFVLFVIVVRWMRFCASDWAREVESLLFACSCNRIGITN